MFKKSQFLACLSACFSAGLAIAQTPGAANLPSGAQVVAGQAQVHSAGNVLTVQQSSTLLATNWQSFNIGAGHTVNFVQPSANSVALNRVVGNEVSRIQGALNANGQVFLLNPNGVLFTPTAQVNVGSLVASTLKLDNNDFLAGRYHFAGESSNAIINQGRISAASGGAVALIAAKISNSGSINAPGGQVLMGAGSKVVMDLGGPVKLKVANELLETLIDNGGAIRADGGQVWLSSQAAKVLASSVINHSGVIEAQSLSSGATGNVVLFAHGGQLNLAGSIQAPGGFVETSGEHFSMSAAARVAAGHWLIDPVDVNIDASLASNIVSALSGGDVSITTSGSNTPSTSSGESAGSGDINVNAPIAWSSNRTLTLSAHNNINVNANISSSNSSAGGAIFLFGQGAAGGGSSAYTQDSAASVTGWSQQWRKGSDANSLRYASVNGDLFLGNQYIEIGISKAQGGKFGSTIKPSLFFGRKTGLSGVGMVGDADGFGVGTDLRIDYFLPGSPEERFTAGYDIAGAASSGANFATTVNGAVYRLLGIGSDNVASAQVSATLASKLKVTQTLKLAAGEKYFTNDVGLENVGSVALDNVTFIRSFDPDNTVDRGGSYNTTQTIDHTRAAGDEFNVVSATSAAGDAYATLSGGSTAKIFYYSTNANSSVGFGGQFFGGTLANMVTRAATQVKGNTETADTGMGILFKPGTIAPAASAGFTFATGLDNRPLSVAVGGITPPSTTAISYTLSPLSVVYKGSAYDLYSLWSPSLMFGSGYTGWTAGTDYQFKLGGTVVSSITLAGNYTGLSVEVLKSGYTTASSGNTLGSLLISPAPLTISASNVRKTYDGVAFSGGSGVSYSGLVGGETAGVLSGSLSYTGSSQGAINAGSSYVLRPQGLSSTNYTIQYADGSLAIDPRPITIAADAKSKVYGNTDPALTWQVSSGSLVGEDTLSGALTRAAGSNVGSYAIDASALANSNYAITANNGTLTISPRPLTVTADAKSKVYGNTDPALTWQVSDGSLVGEDTLSGALTRAAGSNAGSYAIDASALANSNYAITANNGTLTISPRPLTVAADAKSKVYGNTDPALTWQVSDGNLVGEDTLSGALTRAAGSNAGSYAIDASALANSNYAITANNGSLTISPRPLTVTADAKSKVYGNTDPALTWQVSNGSLVGEDTLSGALTRAAGSNVGSYAIDASALANANYAITPVSGAFSITPRPIIVTADNKTKTYGNIDPSLSYQVSGGSLVGSDSLGGALTRASGENIGSHVISAQDLSNSNYAITAINGDLSITPAVNANVIAGNTPSATAVVASTPPVSVVNFGAGAFVMVDVPAVPAANSSSDPAGAPKQTAAATPPAGDMGSSIGSTGVLRMLVVAGGIRLPDLRAVVPNAVPNTVQEGGKEQ
ncbi:MBG domain-containing protein [Roseateles oligotrophus]|uniref:Filamentous hemagglutinin N-terminal domain-containing protein n=1 Tax=Roseateles oligotrophus TaxID=1769250 RepID=A0ABT2YFF9_9BURK|nr:MBG domain-containing protein [Roseateles oligotrophus]MCV2368754.1 filamentous hemagglutinin N-terminal domain-containing protein [Roseateles oligotrophus]